MESPFEVSAVALLDLDLLSALGEADTADPIPVPGEDGMVRKVGMSVGTSALPRIHHGDSEVLIPEGPHRAGVLGAVTPVSECKFLAEHQLSTRVFKSFWDRFRFYSSSWENSQTSVALRCGSAEPWQLSVCLRKDRERCASQRLPPLPYLPNGFSQSWQRTVSHE